MPRQYTHIPVETRLWERVTKSDGCWLYCGALAHGYGTFSGDGRQLYAHRVAFELAYGPIPDGMMVLHTCDNRACVRNDEAGEYWANGAFHLRRGHLWLGTHEDNMADMTHKGRAAIGDRNGKFTRPEQSPRGDNHPARLHPEYIARGDQHYARLHPERLARGESNGARTHPERLIRGEQHHSAKLTEKDVSEIRARFAIGGVSLSLLAYEYGVTKQNMRLIVNRRTWRHVE